MTNIKCKYYENSFCLAAEHQAGIPIPTFESSCQACLAGKSVIPGLIIVERHRLGLEPNLTLVKNGPGTELKKLISWFPIPKKKGCNRCAALEKKMNDWGPDKCRDKMEYIINKLWVSAKRRNIPFSRSLATRLINKAIRNVESK